MVKTYFITGANRGIGLELAKQILNHGDAVIATVRHPDEAAELNQLRQKNPDRCQIKKLDVTSESECNELSASLKGQVVDVLINNAGQATEYAKGLMDLSLSAVEETFRTNVVGPMTVTKALLPSLQKSKQPIITHISSKMGSIADNTSGGAYGYRISKAALNMFNKSLSVEFPNAICVVLHPGWVRTRMGGEQAPLLPTESAAGLFKVIQDLKQNDTGRFLDFRGEEITW